ncbi:MAG: thiamine phosphate synthase [Gemmatimonadales bacterium]
MRPLPRLFAVTDSRICRREDFPVRAAAIASAGSGVAIIVRGPDATAAERLGWLERVRALALPAESAVLGHGDPALARIGAAHGVHLRRGDLSPQDARPVLGHGWIGVSVHDPEAARLAFDEGADYVIAGNVFATPSHPDRAPRGLEWLGRLVRAVEGPVVAIGGVAAASVRSVTETGAWGVAAVTALWDAKDPAATAASMLEELVI